MFHKIRSVTPLENFILLVTFCEGVTKTYDIKPLFDEIPVFKKLADKNEFSKVKVDVGGYGIIWNDEIDLACDELFHNGTIIKSIFDGIIAFTDATELWGLNESTLRKAVSYGKLKIGIDVSKFGNQWVISVDSMVREYGEPKILD